MAEDLRVHDPVNCDCDPCNPQLAPEAAPNLCNCVEDGFRAGLERWKESCSCCFLKAYPDGIDAAVARARS